MNFHYLPIYTLTIALSGSFYLGYLSPIFFLAFIIGSTFTFLIYAKDKRAAQNDEWPTSESTLHSYSLLFGWPGAIVAQQKLRHKSKKQSFRIAFLFTVLINVHCSLGCILIRVLNFLKVILESSRIMYQRILTINMFVKWFRFF